MVFEIQQNVVTLLHSYSYLEFSTVSIALCLEKADSKFFSTINTLSPPFLIPLFNSYLSFKLPLGQTTL